MFESVCDFFERSAAIQPMLMVLEDLHWADESTTQLLESVARRVERAAWLVLGTYRDVDLAPRDPFMRGIEHLSRLAAVSRITLKRLSAGEVGDILRALSGREPPEGLVRLVYDETEGVPLFVEEVYRHLAEERRLTDAAGSWLPEAEIGEIEVPETVRLVLGRRIDRIGEPAQRIMTTAACIGRTFTFEFLAALAEESEDDLLDALDEAERVRLVVAEHRREPRFVFAHEQIRQTFLSRLSFVRRQRLHGRVADTMERVYAGHLDERVSDLAYHLIQAGARERAATYLHQAGSSAAARLATPEALAFFARAAELAGPGPTRRAALRARGELLLGLFRGREATVELELATREAATEGAAAEEMEALLRLGRAYYVVALDYGPAIEHSRHALERAHQLAVQLGDRRAEALALMTRRHFDLPALSAAYEPLRRSGSSDATVDPGFHSQAAANAERALAIARELGDEDLEVDALRAASRIGTTAARLENLDRIALSLERRGDLIALNEHLFDSMWAYWLGCRFADCVTCSDRATALAGRLGIPPVQYGTIKSFALVDLGRFDEAWQALEQEVADDDHPFGQAFQLLGQTWWYLASGDVERVLRDVPRVLADARELKRGWMVRWAERMLEAAMVATQPDGTSVAALKAAVEAAGGRLTRDGLVTAQLLAGNADAALAECERSLPQLDAEGRGRPYWTTEESRARALLALDRFTEVCQAVDSALAVVMPLGWQSLAWRLRASRDVALAGLGDRTAGAAERQAAVDILMTVAGTLHDAAARTRFLSQPAAASLLA